MIYWCGFDHVLGLRNPTEKRNGKIFSFGNDSVFVERPKLGVTSVFGTIIIVSLWNRKIGKLRCDGSSRELLKQFVL